MIDCLRRLAVDDRGEELIEYALLTALVGLAAWLALSSTGSVLASGYQRVDAGVQRLWEPPEPGM